jgi:hypothetical protein
MLQSNGADHMELTFVVAGEIPSKHYPNTFVFRRDYLEPASRLQSWPRQCHLGKFGEVFRKRQRETPGGQSAWTRRAR